jgi:hypothetical protein
VGVGVGVAIRVPPGRAMGFVATVCSRRERVFGCDGVLVSDLVPGESRQGGEDGESEREDGGALYACQNTEPETGVRFLMRRPNLFPFHRVRVRGRVRSSMKTLLRIVPLVLAAAFARADIIIEQKMESAIINGNVVMKVKGDNARMDMPSPLGGNVTTLMNFKSGDMVTLMHQQKMAMKMNLSDVKKQQEAGQKALGVDPSKIEKPKSTGATEKVGEYDTEIFEMNQGTLQAKLWIAKDFPNAQSIKDQMMKLNAAMGGGGIDPSKIDVPGMVVKSEVSTPVGKMTITLVKAKEEPVDEKEFVKPEGYQEMQMPKLPGAGEEKK